MSRMDYVMYKDKFDSLLNELTSDQKKSRMSVNNMIRDSIDNWCYKTFARKYDMTDKMEREQFKKDKTDMFNRALKDCGIH